MKMCQALHSADSCRLKSEKLPDSGQVRVCVWSLPIIFVFFLSIDDEMIRNAVDMHVAVCVCMRVCAAFALWGGFVIVLCCLVKYIFGPSNK